MVSIFKAETVKNNPSADGWTILYEVMVLILEKKNVGGNAALTEKIENYPGFTTISGSGLMKKMAEHRLYLIMIRVFLHTFLTII